MTDLIRLLNEGGYSCVISNHGTIRTFTQRSVADLYDLLKNDISFLQGAQVADKVVGKGAAALMILGGVKEIHAHVISTLALNMLQKTDIKVSFDTEVPHIINRTKTDWCPIEKRVKDCQTAEKTLQEIENFLEIQNRSKES